ncbi:hypothetical protein [Caulobacter sp. 17J65-9]|uniref:hypothetical protein n=1 Tax=Caulobacter sp. 17J65-9 TaxID=2709382 RepID=UPI0013CBEAF9|nr:hypothetical protein [Caulobacter sp. 17J65-9]NEX94016.1 hypothetical protein [Caulobacter sp. 17J65-9]
MGWEPEINPASLALVLALAAGSAPVDRIEWLGRDQRFSAPCDVEVSFGSYASGINAEVAREVRAYVGRSRDVTRAQGVRWGREGEWDLCLTVRPKRASKVYADIRRMIPTYARQGPTSVSSKNGARFESKQGR